MTDGASPSLPADVDAELAAMRSLVLILEPLAPEARSRVIRWAADVFDVKLPATIPSAPPVTDEELMTLAAHWAGQVLDMLEPKELQRAALDSLGMGDSADITAPLFNGIKAAWRQAAGTPEAAELWPST